MQYSFKTFLLLVAILLSTQSWAGSVSRAQFTSEIIDREPTNYIDKLSSDQTQVSYFTELSDLQGHSVTHQWVYNDEVIFEKTFNVGGSRWRVWTSKTLQPDLKGLWVVNTLDEDQSKLLTQSFSYQ